MNTSFNKETAEFIETFGKLETYIKNIVSRKKNYRYEGFRKALDYIKNGGFTISDIINKGEWIERFEKYLFLRNKLSHEDYKKYLSATGLMVEEIKKDLDTLKNPKVIGEIRKTEVFTCKLEDSLENILRIMKENNYTHVPVIDSDGKILDTLSESSILYYILNNIGKDGTLLLENITVSDIDLENENDVYKIVSTQDSIYYIDSIFSKAIVDGKRLGALYITEDGTDNGKLKGIITAWDIPIIQKDFRY